MASLHKKRSLSPKGHEPAKKINKTCKSWKEGNCTPGDKCRFYIRTSRGNQFPPRYRRPHRLQERVIPSQLSCIL